MPRKSTGTVTSRPEPPFTLRVLGRPRIHAGREIELPTRKALAVTAYLAVHGPTTRSRLAALLWSDHGEDAARRNLRQELHRLQSTPVGPWIESRGDELALRLGADIDIDRFRCAAKAANDPEALALSRSSPRRPRRVMKT